MEQFVTRDITKPIADFVATCPFLEEYHIDIGRIGSQRLTKSDPDGMAIECTGSTQVNEIADVLGNKISNRQVNYQVWLLRQSNHDLLRNETANFLFNFEQWVEWSQFQGRCPKISLNANDKKREAMWADGGVFFGEWEDGSKASLYLVQLHISYFNSYYNEED